MIPVLTPSTSASNLHHPHSSKDFQPSTNKYYQQLSFDGNMTLKRYVCFLGLLMFIFEIAQTLFFLPKEVLYSKTRTTISSLVLFSISLSCYYLSIFRLFRRNTPKIFRIRRILLVFSIIAFSSAQSIKLYDEMADRVEANMVEKWYYSLLKGRNEVWTLLLADILMPTWYLKVLPYIGGWISQALVYYEFGLEHREVIWTTSVFSVLLTGFIWGFKNHHEWKLFLIKSTAEAWDDIHRYILDKVPDAIAVIDSDAKITYSNLNFKALCGDSLIDLSQKLTKIKRSEANMFTHFSAEDHHKEEEQTLHGSHREEAIFTISEVLDTIMLPLLKGSLKSEQYLTFNGKMEASPGATRSYEIKIGPLFEYNKIILILSDTTQRDLAISLETANQYKDKLLAAVSHDLRAPINGSLRFIESSIEHEEVPCFIKEQYLIPAQRSCKFLLHLANDILDFSQINAQKLRMNFEACSLVETIKGCFQLLEMQASYKKINFQMVLDEKLPLKFATDHNRLSQVIINLLSNAIKFTFTGGVTLTAKVVGEQPEYPLVEISVVDTGIGIKDKDMHKLFQEFTRIEYEQRDLNTKGVGLGLVISNRLAKKLGPSTKKEGIAVSSVFGEGSTFRFIVEDKKIVDLKGDLARTTSLAKKDGLSSCTISLSYKEEDFLFKNIEEGDMSNARSVHNSPYQSDFSTRRHLLHSMHESSLIFQSLIYKRKQYSGKALVVDDDPVNVFALESLLKQHGVRVEAAYNGKEAIEKVMQSEEGMKGSKVRQRGKKRGSLFREEVSEGYQVIFMDYQMPVMGGIEATRRLKGMMESKEISVIPIIGCTGHQEADMVEECYLNGMIDVVRKPPEKGKLNDILERYMG